MTMFITGNLHFLIPFTLFTLQPPPIWRPSTFFSHTGNFLILIRPPYPHFSFFSTLYPPAFFLRLQLQWLLSRSSVKFNGHFLFFLTCPLSNICHIRFSLLIDSLSFAAFHDATFALIGSSFCILPLNVGPSQS